MSASIPVVTSFDGYKWVQRYGSDDWMGATFFHEPFLVSWLTRYSNHDSVFVDVGAHVGRYCVRMANAVRVIYALEPNPDLFDGLLLNLQLNGIKNVVPIPMAASDQREIIDTPWQGKPHKSNADRLDVVLPEKPDLVLIDVEGAEEKVLRGMERFLNLPNAPTLIVEMHHNLFPDRSNPESIQKFLFERGYAGRQIASQGPLRYLLAVKV